MAEHRRDDEGVVCIFRKSRRRGGRRLSPEIRKSSLIAEHCPLYRTLEYGPDIETSLSPKYITHMEQAAASVSA